MISSCNFSTKIDNLTGFLLCIDSIFQRRVDILKMDVEAMEWQSFPNIIKTGALANVRQMLIEFHTESASLEQLRTLRDIYSEGFRIFWYHRNPAAVNLRQGKFVQNTVCYEVYFVRV